MEQEDEEADFERDDKSGAPNAAVDNAMSGQAGRDEDRPRDVGNGSKVGQGPGSNFFDQFMAGMQNNPAPDPSMMQMMMLMQMQQTLQESLHLQRQDQARAAQESRQFMTLLAKELKSKPEPPVMTGKTYSAQKKASKFRTSALNGEKAQTIANSLAYDAKGNFGPPAPPTIRGPSGPPALRQKEVEPKGNVTQKTQSESKTRGTTDSVRFVDLTGEECVEGALLDAKESYSNNNINGREVEQEEDVDGVKEEREFLPGTLADRQKRQAGQPSKFVFKF